MLEDRLATALHGGQGNFARRALREAFGWEWSSGCGARSKILRSEKLRSKRIGRSDLALRSRQQG